MTAATITTPSGRRLHQPGGLRVSADQRGHRPGGVSEFKDPASGIPFPLSFGRLGMWKAGFYPPPMPPWTATFYTNFVPPLPLGFKGNMTTPVLNRAADFGAIKTPTYAISS